MSITILIEGGGPGDLDRRCREGFRSLLLTCGYRGRMPHLVACGSRNDAFKRFCTMHEAKAEDDFVAMLLDSEDSIDDIEAAWDHLKARDGWDRPEGAEDEQVLFMVTCMETWIVADRATLAAYYDAKFQESILPPLFDLKRRHRHDVQDRLVRATRRCKGPYSKGKHSFDVLGKLDPAVLVAHLSNFVRLRRILDSRL